MKHAECNGAIGIGVRDEGQGQKCKFMYDCLRFNGKLCNLTELQWW